MPLISIIQTIGGPTTNKLISIENTIDEIDLGKVIVQANGKGSKTRFFTLGTKLAFAKLRQVFNRASILHHFDLKFHISIKTDK